MTEQSMVERVARAMCVEAVREPEVCPTYLGWQHYSRLARAAIEAIKDKGDLPLAVTQAGGSVMLKYDYLPDVAGEVWNAMINEALKP